METGEQRGLYVGRNASQNDGPTVGKDSRRARLCAIPDDSSGHSLHARSWQKRDLSGGCSQGSVHDKRNSQQVSALVYFAMFASRTLTFENRCIINVSSTSGLHGNVGQANYAAGVVNLAGTPGRVPWCAGTRPLMRRVASLDAPRRVPAHVYGA